MTKWSASHCHSCLPLPLLSGRVTGVCRYCHCYRNCWVFDYRLLLHHSCFAAPLPCCSSAPTFLHCATAFRASLLPSLLPCHFAIAIRRTSSCLPSLLVAPANPPTCVVVLQSVSNFWRPLVNPGKSLLLILLHMLIRSTSHCKLESVD